MTYSLRGLHETPTVVLHVYTHVVALGDGPRLAIIRQGIDQGGSVRLFRASSPRASRRVFGVRLKH